MLIPLAMVLAGGEFRPAIGQDPPAPPARPAPRQLPGTQPAGEILLPNQWSIKPVGDQIVVGDFPVNMVFHPSQNYLAVLHAGYGNHEVQILDTESKKMVSSVNIAQTFYGLCFSLDGSKLYASGGDSETIKVYDFKDGYLTKVNELSVELPDREGLIGGVSTSVDGKTIYAAVPWGDLVAIIDTQVSARTSKIEFPTQSFPYTCIADQWDTELHPTEMIFSPDGRYLYVACVNSNSVNVFDVQENKKIETIRSSLYPTSPEQMIAYTKTAFQCSPIKYCIYIIKENRTYDQVLGDLPQGNGDPDLCIFPRTVTPNHHALAEQFVLLDNFYVESEVSADGHEWTMAAYATDFVEKSWPLSYRGGRGPLSYPSEGAFEIATPAGGYFWDRCREAGVSYRSYGEFIANGATPEDPSTAKVEALEGHFDPYFHGYDLDYMDIKRADRFPRGRRFNAERSCLAERQGC